MTETDLSADSLVRNDRFDKSGFVRGRSRPIEILWYICKSVFFLSPWPWPSSLKRRMLIAFGAKVGTGLVIRPRVNIHFPWKLEIGNHCWIGERDEILNLDYVVMEDHVALGHDVYIAAAGHDITSASMAYKNRKVRIGRGSWVATRAYVGPGVTIGEGSVVAAGAVVVKDVAVRSVVAGIPAHRIAERIITRP